MPNLVHTTFLFLLLLASIPSQNVPFANASLIDQCTLSVYALFTDARVNACIPYAPLVQLSNGTDITPKLVNDTCTTFCAMPFCSAATVSLMENTMNQNCVDDADDASDGYWWYGVASLYVPFKQGMCQRLQESPTNGTFCIAVLTDSMNAYIKKHPSKHGWAIFGNSTQLQQYVDSIPNNLLCTACNKAMLNPLDSFVSLRMLSLDATIVSWVRALQAGVQRRCGVDFMDGLATPPVNTTNHATSVFRGPRAGGYLCYATSVAVLLVSTFIPWAI